MFYCQMRQYDTANGPGIRATLFVSGCSRRCKNCHNQEAQAFDHGKEWSPLSKALFLDYCANPYVTGITILGGEPFEQTQDNDLIDLLQTIKKTLDKPIWIYSGYLYEELVKEPKRHAILALCDVLIDGPYIEYMKDLTLKYRGSLNQRVIAVQASLAQNQIIEIFHD